MSVWYKYVGQFKSSLRESFRGVLRSRNTQAKKVEQLTQQVRELKARGKKLAEINRQKDRRLNETQQLLELERRDNEELRQQPLRLPSDLPLPNHTYGPKMISLCLNLGKEIGFRPAETALKIVFNALEIEARIPSFDSIRVWSSRMGVAELERLPESADDWIWIADHSNQIGAEKVLLILGIRAANVPPSGETLRLEDMRVLAMIPGTQWKRDDVRREYKALAERIGPPRYLLTDGAVELFESADVLEIPGKKLTVLRDMKHFAANTFEKQIGKDPRFAEYLSALGRTRCQVQQTELSHFTSPSQKPKARFMNLGPILRWGLMVSFHLSHPRSKSRQGIKASRMNEKLGWVRGFRSELASWNRCQQVMQTSLRFINTQGVFVGGAASLESVLKELMEGWGDSCDLSQQMAETLIQFVQASESLLEHGERSWLSTEIIESTFGMFKRLEGQHSKGGFTSLLSALPTLLIDWTPERVRENLAATSVKQMQAWVKKNLGHTLASKRSTAYKEFTPTLTVS